MCDYSLHGIRSRLAEKGELLMVHRFSTGSKGLTAPDYLPAEPKAKGLIAILKTMLAGQPNECAVCIPDGARLRIDNIPPMLRESHELSSTELVTFRQLSPDANTYRDAVEFSNGAKVRLQELENGQRFQVLALSSEEAPTQEEIVVPIRKISAEPRGLD
jgi:hypothetical protein